MSYLARGPTVGIDGNAGAASRRLSALLDAHDGSGAAA